MNDINADVIEFAVFCIENLAQALRVDSVTLYDKLKDSGILYTYIIPAYEILHTQGKDYIIDDIVGYMREKGIV